VGEQVAEYFHPADRERVTTAFQTVVTSEDYTAESVEYRHEQVDGTYLWVESVASANPTPDGHYVINTRNISERKQRERELERQNERLDEFAGVVSHDLRNPLHIARGRLALIAEECESDHIEAIERAHDRMATLIEDLLTLAREGDELNGIEPVDLGDLVWTCWQHVETGDASMRTDIDMQIRADTTCLQQLLENLIQNAVKHTGDDVTVTVGELDDGFYFEDDGPGIAPENRAAVFETDYSTAQSGTGLGLKIVERVVEAHEWEICVSEGTDGGTRFEILGIESS